MSLLTSLSRKKSIEQLQRDAASGFTDAESHGNRLKKTLGVVDLTAFGIAAVIGAGIFSSIGTAASNGGPAVVFLFIFTAVACGFSALCYAEFASMIPVAGSAYTYAYASFGELLAWIIGWDLLMEYAIGNIAVAISWSDYFTSLMAGYNLPIPDYLTMDFLTAWRGSEKVAALVSGGQSLESIKEMTDIGNAYAGYLAWNSAPVIGNLRVVCDLPALGIVVLITALVYIGIQESRSASNVMVALKLAVIVMVIVLGAFCIKPENWSPFAPNGVAGVMKGVSAVFFAYIGFDAISTTAEECKNPQRDLPLGMMYALGICTALYALVALVLTGMVSYKQLAVGDPLAFVFGSAGANLPWISGIVAVSAVIAMSTVLLVFQMGQPRIWMTMSRDGLLPKIFSDIHPKFKTPWFATIVTGFVVAVPSLFLNLTEVTDLTSIGTLFAFVLVCGGLLVVQARKENIESKFKAPVINSKWIVPALVVLVWAAAWIWNGDAVKNFFTFGSWDETQHKLPMLFYIVITFGIAYLSFAYSLSLIPVLGLESCLYLMTELGVVNWTRFLIWLIIGLVIYFFYGFRKSRLAQVPNEKLPALSSAPLDK